MEIRLEMPDAAMLRVYRAMAPWQRLQAGLAATEMVRDRLRAHFREVHPEWSQPAIEAAVADRLLNGSV